MTYSADCRAQVIISVKNKDMSIRQACTFYDISKTALQRWLKDSSIRQTRDKPLTKIPNEALLKDVEQHADDCTYERAQRFRCSKSGIEAALRCLGISQKKTLAHPKACPLKRAQYLRKTSLNAMPLYTWMRVALKLRPFALMAMYLLGPLASIVTTGKVKNKPTLLVPYIKKRYLP